MIKRGRDAVNQVYVGVQNVNAVYCTREIRFFAFYQLIFSHPMTVFPLT